MSSPEMHPLLRLRPQLAALGVDGFLIPRADKHQGETVAAADERLAWTTGFTGSAGAAVVLQERAALLVDGRYELQAAAQIDGDLFEVVATRETPLSKWLPTAVGDGARLGFDPWLHPPAEIEALEKALKPKGATLVALEANPIDEIWTDRPDRPTAPAYAHPERFAGRSAAEKRTEVAKTLVDEKLDAAVLTLPDGIAWLLNIRGADQPNLPATQAFAVIEADGGVKLYSDPAKFDATLRALLGPQVAIADWDAFPEALAGLAGKRVALAKNAAPEAVARALRTAKAEIVWRAEPTTLPKARKNAAEIAGARAAHLRDGAAMAATLAWIDAEAEAGGLDELMVAARLTEERRAAGDRLGQPFVDESFSPIVGFGPNGAIVHYRVDAASNRRIEAGGVLLLDSGAQFQDGTTDVTRTVAIGSPPGAARTAATRVLQGMIAISVAWFPEKTKGRELDALARRALWSAGLDYDHGTGHGVGSFLGVHEGPAGLSKRAGVDFEPGMILSNEPGYYRRDAFGIRIENLILVRAAEIPPGADAPDARKMLSFETLTLAPFDRRLIDVALLSAAERAWIDAYHARVLAEIGPLVSGDVADWLRRNCAPLA